MTNTEIVGQIEKDQEERQMKHALDALSLLDKPSRKQLKNIATKLKFMFGDKSFEVVIEYGIFRIAVTSSLTLDYIEHAVLKYGKEFADKGLSIDGMLMELAKISDKELKDRDKKPNKFLKFFKRGNNS